MICSIYQLTLVTGRLSLDPSDGLTTPNLMSNAPPFSLLPPVQSIHLSYANGIWLADLDADAWKLKVHHGFTIRAIAAVVVCYIFGFAFNAAQPWLPGHGEAIAVVWTFCTWAALITAAVAVTRYWTVDRPRLERGRSDLQVAMFQELQRQISELQNGRKA